MSGGEGGAGGSDGDGGSVGEGSLGAKQILKPPPTTEWSDVQLNDEVVTPSGGPAAPLYCTPFTVTLSQHDSVLKKWTCSITGLENVTSHA